MRSHPSGHPVRTHLIKKYGTERSYWSQPLTPRLRLPTSETTHAVSYTYSGPTEEWGGAWVKGKPGFVQFE